jgi:protein-disulfide isomerase
LSAIDRLTLSVAGLCLTAILLAAASPAGAQEDEEVTLDPAALLVSGTLTENVMGSAEAPVTMIEYASMTCPHCASFHAATLPRLKEKYIETGKVRLIFREFPTDGLAAAAAMLARCVDDQRFFPFIDVLLRNQRTWVNNQPEEPLKKLARQVGLTEESFDNCLANQELLDGIASVQDRARTEFEVQSTPTFFINGRQVRGALPFAEFEKIIEAELAD